MENIYKQLKKSEQSTKIEKRISPELAALAGWYLSGDVTRGMGQPTPAQQREFERQIQQAMRKKGRRLRKDDAIEKMQQFFKTRDSADTYVRKTPVKNAVQADILIEPFLDKKLAFPPKAGQVWEPTAHRWVNPSNYAQTYSARGGRKRIRGSGTGVRERSVSGHGKGRIRYEGAGRRFKGETDLAAQRRKQGFTHTAFKRKKSTKAKGGFKHGRSKIK